MEVTLPVTAVADITTGAGNLITSLFPLAVLAVGISIGFGVLGKTISMVKKGAK